MKRNYLGHFFLIAIVFIFALSAVTSNGIPGLNANWSLGVSVLEQKRQEEADRWIRELYEQKLPGSVDKSVFSAPEFQDFSAYTLEPLAAALIDTEDSAFSEQYPKEILFSKGILRSHMFSPHILYWAEGQDPIPYHTGLIYTSEFQGPVLEKVGIGSSFLEITAQLGEPQFQAEDYGYIGYKTREFYIAFRSTVNGGKADADPSLILTDRIYLEKRYPLPDDLNNILFLEEDFFLSPRFHQVDLDSTGESFICYDTQFYRGGWNRGYLFGMDVDTYSRSFVLWADFEGELPIFDLFGHYDEIDPSYFEMDSPYHDFGFRGTRKISYVYEMDFPQWRIDTQCQWEDYLANMFATEGVATADGSKAAVALKNTIYERSRVWIRSLTGDFPDRCFSGGHYTEKLAWLDNRYLLCQVYLQDQPFLYDFETDTGLYFDESPDLPDLPCEIGESFQVISVDKDEKQILLSHCDSLNKEIGKLTLHYDFDESGSILFTDLID